MVTKGFSLPGGVIESGPLADEDLEEEEAEQRAKARRSPSPRESWFEMTHPMGYWNESRWW